MNSLYTNEIKEKLAQMPINEILNRAADISLKGGDSELLTMMNQELDRRHRAEKTAAQLELALSDNSQTISEAVKVSQIVKTDATETPVDTIQEDIKPCFVKGQKLNSFVTVVDVYKTFRGFTIRLQEGTKEPMDIAQSKLLEILDSKKLTDKIMNSSSRQIHTAVEQDMAPEIPSNAQRYQVGDVVRGFLIRSAHKTYKGKRNGYSYYVVPVHNLNAKPIKKKQSYFGNAKPKKYVMNNTVVKKTVDDFTEHAVSIQPVEKKEDITKYAVYTPINANAETNSGTKNIKEEFKKLSVLEKAKLFFG